MTLTVGSLFSGIGGLDLGLERAGMKVVWQCEKDPYARKVLSKHWPDVPCYEDIRDVCGRQCDDGPGHAERVDVLCGGFPCQDISNAGKRAGINGSRSGLWAEYARLIHALRPKWVIIENVPALRSRGLGRVLSDLSACGYDAEWDGVSAAHVGAPHRRDRIWVVAYAKREPLRVESGRSGGAHGQGPFVFGRDGFEGALADTDGQRELQPSGRVGEVGRRSGNCGEHVADADLPGLEVGFQQPAREERPAVERGGLSDDPWAVEPDVGRVANGVPNRMDRLRCLGNAVVPQVAELIGRLVVQANEVSHV